jgi:hypothetical protein
MTISKRTTYKQTIARLDEALGKQFFLEASWIEYAIFEDRCNSLLEKTGGLIPPSRNGIPPSINKKLTVLKERTSGDPFLSSTSEFPDILRDVRNWKNRRNTIMHSLVDVARSWNNINQDAKQLAIDGRALLGRFSSATMKVRKKYKKAGN